MIATCPLCHAQTTRVLATKLRRGEGVVYHCALCDLGFLIGAQPTDYSGEYRQQVSHRAAGGPASPQEVFDAYRLYQGDRLRLIEPYLGPEVSVLEIGAGAGQFIHHLKDRAKRLVAVEPDVESRKFMGAMGIETAGASVERERPDRFDLVCAFQVLEHAEDPVAFLRDVRAVLKPGGHAVIEVPNLKDFLRTVPAYDAFYFHSDHRYYFSDAALVRAAHAAGFAEGAVSYHQDYHVLNALSWHLTGRPQATNAEGMGTIKLSDAWLTDRLLLLNAEYVDRLKKTGTTSNIAVILKRE